MNIISFEKLMIKSSNFSTSHTELILKDNLLVNFQFLSLIGFVLSYYSTKSRNKKEMIPSRIVEN